MSPLAVDRVWLGKSASVADDLLQSAAVLLTRNRPRLRQLIDRLNAMSAGRRCRVTDSSLRGLSLTEAELRHQAADELAAVV